MPRFQQKYNEWLQQQMEIEQNPRRRERLEKGLGHGTVEFLRTVWFPAIGHFEHLYPEWEVRDLKNGYRYLDLGYLPGDAKGCVEIQGYKSHARDLDVRKFKDLCNRHCLLSLDDWVILPVAYPSITDEPKHCQQLVLSFVGKFLSIQAPTSLDWMGAEAYRFARRTLRPFSPHELAQHLRVSDRHTRRLLHELVDKQILAVASGNARARTYALKL
ncbi:transcriptional regulator [Paenibacillus koleovorans]|uniref:transcriptional regulator n=1 Tax=Paenibacillus koleovorans TaxID=121608 RepID=UPI000FDCB31A|nr:transcriptional regulator [Paenibacillus koleovorans]